MKFRYVVFVLLGYLSALASARTPSSPVSSLPPSSGGTSPTCSPTWSLIGAAEFSFNPQNSPVTAQLPCAILDVNNYTVFLNSVPVLDTTNTSNSITFPGGFADIYVQLAIFALDINGNPFLDSFDLYFGLITMPVLVLGVDGNPAAGVFVQANATTYIDVGQSGYTDSAGMITFTNVIASIIGLIARDIENEIGVDGIAATESLVTLSLMPFNMPSTITNLDFSNGTAGWIGPGTITPRIAKRDNDLVVSTGDFFNLQTESYTFVNYPFTQTVYIRYKFQTDEVPGGYFGTQSNDYYSIIIRSNTGGYATVTNSMNGLGIGAFDAPGATQWYVFSFDTDGATVTQFDVGVSNVVDNLLPSEVVIDMIGDLTCDECGNCANCPGDPMLRVCGLTSIRIEN